MRRSTRRADDLSEEDRVAKRVALVEAMMTQALLDDDYSDALFTASLLVIGFRSVVQSVPLDALMEQAREVVFSGRQIAEGRVLQ